MNNPNPDLERYLRLATWGLWGTRKRTVRLELESHVRHKAWKYQLLELNETQAIARALEDLGQPQAISAGMSQVYTMPTILRNSFLCAVLATLGVSNLTSSAAQVIGSNQIPISECLEGKTEFERRGERLSCSSGGVTWLSRDNLRQVLEPLGVRFEIREDPFYPMWKLHFPQATTPVRIVPERQTILVTRAGAPSVVTLNRAYVRLSEFLSGFRAVNMPVTITGWDNPTLEIGNVRFTLGTTQAPIKASDVYGGLLLDLLDETNRFPPLRAQASRSDLEDLMTGGIGRYVMGVGQFENGELKAAPKAYQHELLLSNSAPGDVYLVLSREGPTNMVRLRRDDTNLVQIVRRVSIHRVSQERTITYASPSKTLTVSNTARLPRGDADGHGEIHIVRFTGRLDSSQDQLPAVSPSDVRIVATK